jgi:hypothetical protein
MKYCSFDLEIAKEIEGPDWGPQRPLGISCAATICTNDAQPTLWFDGHYAPAGSHYGAQMNRDDCQELVVYLLNQCQAGFIPLTWNGLSFDFDILAEESGMHAECADLAMHHVDMMFQVICLLGYPIGLETCLKGMELPGKQGMTGADAPRLWKTDPQTVLTYVSGDVTGPLRLAEMVAETKAIRWYSKHGYRMTCLIDHWLTVEECLKHPQPDTSWMSDPKPREHYYRWMEKALNAPGKD